MTADLFVAIGCAFGSDGDHVHRYHAPSRALSRVEGVTVVECDVSHRFFLEVARAADVLVMAGTDTDMLTLMQRRRAEGRVTVFEANDWFDDLHAWNPLLAHWLGEGQRDAFRRFLRASDAIQTSTPELARRWAARGVASVAVFRNHLADVAPLPSPPSRPLTIGWGGSPGHLADWYHVTSVLQRWLAVHPDVHLAVMTNPYAQPFIDLPAERYHVTPFGSLDDYSTFLRGLDIGLAPLLATDYNRCRSDVKFLEYAAHGVPGIFADLEPYRDSVVDGETGLLYRSDDDLVRALDRLAGDGALRARIRDSAYACVSRERRLETCVVERSDFYRGILPTPPRGFDLSLDALACALQHGRHFELRPGAPEEAFRAATASAATRASVEALTRIVEAHPTYLLAFQALGRQLNDLRNPAAALQVLEAARVLDPGSARTMAETGRARFLQGERDAARHLLQSAVTSNPGYTQGWEYLLRLLFHDDGGQAAAWALRACEENPLSPRIALTAVQLLAEEERPAALEAMIARHAPTLHPHEKPRVAAAFSEVAASLSPAVLAGASGQRMLARACSAFPDSARLAALTGDALRRAGRAAESHAHFARALSLQQAVACYQAEHPQGEDLVRWQLAAAVAESEGAHDLSDR